MMVVDDLVWNYDVKSSKSAPCSPVKSMLGPAPQQPTLLRQRSDPFHITHKVPIGDTPYVKAKRVQLVEKDPDKAIPLFWAAINAGDRVDSALKDMAIVMKQQNRPEEAIEAIMSFRNRCTDQAQESLDNILLDLYKRCGRLDDQIGLLRHKLHQIQQGLAFNGRRTKTARSQGRKFQVSVQQEATRLLGNLGWALMQQENYMEAEAAYRRALLIGPDNNKMCNLGICLMKQGRVAEAKATLRQVKPAVADGPRGVDSHLKAYERAQEMLHDLESSTAGNCAGSEESGRSDRLSILEGNTFLGSAWQPQPCVNMPQPQEAFGDENAWPESFAGNPLNAHAPPFYSKKTHDPPVNLKRTRSNAAATDKKPPVVPKQQQHLLHHHHHRLEEPETEEWLDVLPDDEAFDEALVASILAPILGDADEMTAAGTRPPCEENKNGKRLKVFQDITRTVNNNTNVLKYV